ncbi:Co2+/Mg2+ efflux protein ApaG [Aurantivibrio infirmus]
MKSAPIEVTVKTTYIPEQSRPKENRYVYTYTITITNCGDQAAQLMNRHWIISDANEKIQEVQGEGVVGQQPRLAPGDNYTYTSGVILETQFGTMRGSYEMKTDLGDLFEAAVPAFALVPPQAIH